MVQYFMKKLEKDMISLDESIAMNEATLEQLTYRIIESLYNQLKVWTTYLQRKSS
jgi:hypothetical protein